jgi:Domain of unknown function (DUF4386)
MALSARTTAVVMISAAVLVNVAFTGLGMVFDYPDVLKHPSADVLASFRASQGPVSAWFLLLAVGAALLAPVALGVGRLSDRDRSRHDASAPVSRATAMRWAVRAGVAAAIVQVVGLLRWPLLVPGWAAAAAGDDPVAVTAAEETFATANRVLGNLVGETGGYLLTAAWTALVLVALGTGFAGRLFVGVGAASAVLILLGIASPLDLPIVDLANFAGYVLWSGWLVAFAVVLLRRRSPVETRRAARMATG